MNEISTTLIVIVAILVVAGQAAGIASFILLILQGRRMKELADSDVLLKAATVAHDKKIALLSRRMKVTREEQHKRFRRLAKDKSEDKDHVEKLKTEVVEGQFKLAELLTTGLKANTEYLSNVAKSMTDSTFDVVNKNTDDVLKLSTENSQKVYDALVVLIQMTNGLMTALGYRPTAPDPGLEDPKKGPSYNKPPAPEEQDGLTYAR